jgi:ligand-binding sensor domain-containing protein/AAA+ ATPase superfamily predicted ATPase
MFAGRRSMSAVRGIRSARAGAHDPSGVSGRSANVGRRIARVMALVFGIVSATSASQQVPLPPPVEGGVTVKGTVVGPSGPLPSVRVQVTGSGHFDTVLTRIDGTFEMNVPKPGAYSYAVDDAGYKPAKGTFRIEQPGVFAAPQIRLNVSSLHVRVLSQDGEQPLDAVTLVATPRNGGSDARGTTDRSGEHYFGALEPGSYTLVASLAGYNPVVVDGVYVTGGGETFDTTLLLVKGASVAIAGSRVVYRAPQVPSGTVQCVYQDGLGNVWLGTERGVTSFDGANFDGSDTPGSALAPLSQVGVRAVREGRNGIWIGTSNGLVRLESGRLTSDSALSGVEVRSIVMDRTDTPIVATSAGLFRGSESGFERLAEGSFTSVGVDVLDASIWVVGGPPPGLHRLLGRTLVAAGFATSPALNGYAVTSILRTNGADLLVGTAVGAFRVVPGEAAAETVAPFLPETIRGVAAIAEDVRGNIWFGTDRGAVIYDLKRRVTERFFDGERITSLLSDRESNLWFGTDQGAIKYDLYSFVPMTTSRGLLNNNVEYIYADPVDAGRSLWLVTAGGLQRFDGTTFEVVQPPEQGAAVRHLLRDRTGAVWFATTRGIYRGLGRDTSRVSDHSARWLAETRDGRLWAATDRGVERFGPGGFEAVRELSNYVASRVFAVDGHLWVTTDRNAVRYDTTNETVDAVDVGRGLEGQDVRWITADGRSRLWFATDAGIEVIDAETLLKLPDNGGVNAAADAETLMLDADGFMWAGLEGGRVAKIAFFDGGVIEAAFTADQLGVAGTVVNAIAQDAAGSIWFATNGGTTQHSPTKTAPSVSYWIEVDGRRADEKTIPAGPHTIRFHFNGVSTLGDLRYLYRLDGSGDWQLLPARAESARDVAFEKLPAGMHTFELRALNRDLYGIQTAPTSIRIVIDVPVWRKGWFYGFGLVVLAGLGAGVGVVYRYRTREFVLPPELATYVPIDPNPYIVGNPIRNESMFFGREDDFRYVHTKLDGASQGVVIVLCGERRTGKSSILYQILNGRLGERFVPVFIDLQEMVVANDREFFRRIARLVGERVGMDRPEVETFGFADASLNPYHQFVDFLDAVLERLGDKTLLMLVDEYELLEQKVEEQRLDPEIFLFLAGLMDSKERLSFVFTGSRRLEERDRRYWREILRRSFFRKVGFLSSNDAQRLATEPVTGRVVYGRNVVDHIVRLTAGQPFYTQVVCQNVVDYLNEHERNALGKRDLDHVVAEIVDHPLPQMIYSWEALSPDEKVVLALLAESLDSDGTGWASASDLVGLIGRIHAPVDLSENTIHLTLEELFRSELLEKNAFEEYRFRIDLLRLWVRRSHSIWQVIKER